MKKTVTLQFVRLLCVILLFISTFSNAQVGIGTTSPNANAELDIFSTTRGVLLPRLLLTNTTNSAPLSSHIAGMIVYNTATTGNVIPGFYYNNGSNWGRLGDAWTITGNSGTTAGTNFIGTTDAQDLVIKANSIEHFRVGQTTTTINEDAADYDFKVESDNESNMLFVNGGTNQVFMKANVHHMGFSDSFAVYSNSGALDFANTGWNLGTSGGGGNFVIEDTTNPDSAMEATTDGTGIAVRAVSLPTTGTGIGAESSANSSDGYGVYASIPTTGSWFGLGGYFEGGLGYADGLYDLSDSRAKKDVEKIEKALEKILNIQGYSYKYDKLKFNEKSANSDKTYYGFIAQEIKQILPHVVAEKNIQFRNQVINPRENKKESSTSTLLNVVNYIAVIPVLVEAIKEQQKIIESLENKVNDLNKK